MAGPGQGFINIWLKPSYVERSIRNILRNGLKPPIIEKKYRIIVDFSSPNMTKELHVGHLRSILIGETLCRLMEFVGHDVIRFVQQACVITTFTSIIIQYYVKSKS